MTTTASRRPRVIDAQEIARNYRETFTQKDVKHETPMRFTWPASLQHVGDSMAVAYASDKWKADGDYELYKHIAESRNRALCVTGLLVDFHRKSRPYRVIGPTVSFAGAPMPRHFAVLGYFEECNLRLHTSGSDDRPRFGRGGDEGIVKVYVKHGMLAGSKVRWLVDTMERLTPKVKDAHDATELARCLRVCKGGAELDDADKLAVRALCKDHRVRFRDDQPFLLVYTESDGVLMLIVGEELDIERDGIVG